MVDVLAKRGANIEIKDNENRLPVFIAVDRGNCKRVNFVSLSNFNFLNQRNTSKELILIKLTVDLNFKH